MRNKGTICMILGLLFIAGALGLVLYNHLESEKAGQNSAAVLSSLYEAVSSSQAAAAEEDTALDTNRIYADQIKGYREMKMTELDGDLYIGVLEIPSLELILPVMADWNYEKLRTAPCRYTGSYCTNDLVICGHNYDEHFSPIKWIAVGADVYFTTVEGETLHYTVSNRETVQATAIEEMITGDWDMTLFTCTTGGRARCAVRCRLAEDGPGSLP